MSNKKKAGPLRLEDGTGQNLSPEFMKIVRESLITSGMVTEDENGDLWPTGRMIDGQVSAVRIETNEDGEVEDAEQLEEWEIPMELKQ